MRRTIPLPELLATWAPGSQDDRWTWPEECRWVWANDGAHMAALVASILDEGQREPVGLGDDGRIWDGHHRICALIAIGAETVDTEDFTMLPEDTQMERLLDAIGDLEMRQ